MPSPDYDPIAPTYHERYRARPMHGIAACLHRLAEQGRARRAIEVGCGTGRWLDELKLLIPEVFGLDLSVGMLRKSKEMDPDFRLVLGQAAELPFPTGTFDLVLCVNAIHHFPDPGRFIHAAARILRPGGILAVVGMDPHRRRDRWYLYHYFQSTYETDLGRYPSGGQILDWMAAAGFRQAQWGIAEHIFSPQAGEAVLADPFLQKNGTSQLILLSDQDYGLGMERIRSDLREAAAHAETIVFPVDIELTYIAGILRTCVVGRDLDIMGASVSLL